MSDEKQAATAPDEHDDRSTPISGNPGQDHASEVKSDGEEKEDDLIHYPPRKVVVPAIASVYLAVFLVSLDRTILGTAIPAITNDFNSFGDTGWYESGYLLPLCMLQLTFGRVFKYYPAKWILVTLVAMFVIGSIVGATAPTSSALIGGRVISGVGSAGINSGGLIIINQLVPLKYRPAVTGGTGALFGISSILGPILGGFLTSITWRWCFWINVPIGGVALFCLIFLAKSNDPPVRRAPTWKGKFQELDPLGFILIAPATVSLLLAVDFGGTTYAENSPTIIALYVVFGVLFIAFVGTQIWRGEKATVVPRIIMQRSILWGCISTLGFGSVLVLLPYYLPVWFQVVQAKSPQTSGLSLLPLLLSVVFSIIVCGVATSMIGYYTQFVIIGSALSILGTGLISTWTPEVSAGAWIGYQIIVGVGTGMTLQGPQIAAQTVLSQADVSIGLSCLGFVALLGATVFVTAAQNLLNNQLFSRLQGIIPNLDRDMIVNGGATNLRNLVPADQLPNFLNAYNESLKSIWYLALGLSFVGFLASWGLEWKSVKTEQKKDPVPAA